MRRAGTALALAAALAGCLPGASERPRGAAAGPGYVVRPGDTLSGIAARLGVGMTALARANGLAPPYLIRVGQRLALPNRGEPPQPQSASRPVVQPLPRATPAPAPAPAALARAPRLAWPADGPVSERFGSGGDPRGIAIAAHPGAAVRAAAGGTVLFAGEEPQRYGLLVLVDHGGGWVSAYAHLARIVVREGETLRAGARLGFVGTSGAAEAPKLHFELRRDTVPVDPLPRLPPRF